MVKPTVDQPAGTVARVGRPLGKLLWDLEPFPGRVCNAMNSPVVRLKREHRVRIVKPKLVEGGAVSVRFAFPPQSHKVEPVAVVLDHLMQACNISNDQAGDQVHVRDDN